MILVEPQISPVTLERQQRDDIDESSAGGKRPPLKVVAFLGGPVHRTRSCWFWVESEGLVTCLQRSTQYRPKTLQFRAFLLRKVAVFNLPYTLILPTKSVSSETLLAFLAMSAPSTSIALVLEYNRSCSFCFGTPKEPCWCASCVAPAKITANHACGDFVTDCISSPLAASDPDPSSRQNPDH